MGKFLDTYASAKAYLINPTYFIIELNVTA